MKDYIKTVVNVPCIGRFHIAVAGEQWRLYLEQDGMYVAGTQNVFFDRDDPFLFTEDSNAKTTKFTLEDWMWDALLSKIKEMQISMENDANPQAIHLQGTA